MATGLINFTDALKSQLEDNVLINKYSMGDIDEVALDRKQQYPLAHVVFDTGSNASATSTVECSILFIDIVDDDDNDDFSNAQLYILNNMLIAATQIGQHFLRGNLYSNGYQVDDTIEVEFFNERFEDLLAGVVITFTVTFENNIELC